MTLYSSQNLYLHTTQTVTTSHLKQSTNWEQPVNSQLNTVPQLSSLLSSLQLLFKWAGRYSRHSMSHRVTVQHDYGAFPTQGLSYSHGTPAHFPRLLWWTSLAHKQSKVLLTQRDATHTCCQQLIYERFIYFYLYDTLKVYFFNGSRQCIRRYCALTQWKNLVVVTKLRVGVDCISDSLYPTMHCEIRHFEPQ